MTTSTAGLLVMALAAGAAGALGTTVILDPGTQGGTDDGALAGELVALRQQVSELDSRNGQLMQRLSDLELRALSTAADHDGEPTPILASPEMVADLQQQVAKLNQNLGQGEAGALDLESLDAALEVLRERDEAERREERDAMREARLEQRIAEVAQELGLNSYQSAELTKLADYGSEQRDAIMDQMRESGNWDGMREAFEGLGADLDARLAAFLTADQVAGFDELGGMRSLGGRGGPGGGGGFGGGGGGRRGRGGNN